MVHISTHLVKYMAYFLMAWLISIYFMQEHNIKYQSFKLIHYITATVQLSVGLILVITTYGTWMWKQRACKKINSKLATLLAI